MTPSRATVGSRLAVVALLALAALVVSYWALVCTRTGQRFDVEAFVGRDAVPVRVGLLAHELLSSVTVTGLAITVAIFVGWGAVRRMPWRGLCAAGAFGAAVCAAEILKHFLPRPTLAGSGSTGEFTSAFNTFPSGHTTIVTSGALAVVLLSAASVRAWIAVIGALVASGASTGVLIIGWHRGSDAIGGVALSVLAMTCAALLSLLGDRSGEVAKGHGLERAAGSAGPRWAFATLAAAGVMLASVGVVWVVGAVWGDRLLLADRAFEVMTSAIIAATWIGVMAFGWAVRRLA